MDTKVKQINTRLPLRTIELMRELIEAGYGTQTQVIMLAIERMHMEVFAMPEKEEAQS